MTARTFLTDTGVEVTAVTADEMREIDRIAVDETGPNLFQMMENAGRNLARSVTEFLGTGWRSVPIVVLAGTGGNGGGGICAARHLANRGADVTLVVSAVDRLTGVSRDQLAVFAATPGRLESVTGLDRLESALVVDALIGYSLQGPPQGMVAEMVDWIAGARSPVVSLDVASGIDATSGEAPGVHVRAALTVTLALPKTGLDVPAVGDLLLADIGIPAQVYRRAGVEVAPNVFDDRFLVPVRPAC